MTSTDCPPLAERITKSLLGYGVLAGPFYVIVAAAQAVLRDGYDPTRHSVSQLANGDFGWIQVVNFVATGAMTIAAAVGIGRALPTGRAARWATVLLCGYGAGLVAAAGLRADPSDGFPPGTPRGVGPMSRHGTGHLLVAGLGFACLIAAGFVVGAALRQLNAVGWAWFSRITATVFAAAFLALASGMGGRAAVIAFTVAVVWVWAWLAAISVMLYPRVGST
ncbi:DUF998 domain-containing protein [Mycolicibacterium rufum]|uniref:DUF998 domain-containing protein n=1 Tax=Mycolicibacterium rufum TaxID=318424 RepID=A0A9X3BSV8_9MYCO|nr:DUF998 domain-containing protein [Mycolicibacterium rufum]KGI67424.1 hypothetical protein EU78_08185 [Mycolicibacterium rufum]MCV7072746.1 DUF998 domain-containing protein [Mycolicibacterium rufum]ULP38368.1 DUF998 domain-containing protein [Mycolicibacterium rufum]